MARQMMALCDSNIHYGTRLVDYLEQQKGFPYSVMHFSDVEQLKLYEEKQKYYEGIENMEYLILGEDLYSSLKDDIDVRKIFLLTREQEGTETEGEKNAEIPETETDREKNAEIPETGLKNVRADREDTDSGGCRSSPKIVQIYRYQPAGNIMRRILGNLAEEDTLPAGVVGTESAGSRIGNPGMKIIGVYSPVGRCMQTSFALLLGQLLTRQKRTLYLNLEGFSGFRSLLGKELKPDITDFMYYAERDRAHFMTKLEHMIDTIGGLEYIPPATTFMDLGAITEEQWIRMFRELEKDGRFGYLILDLTEHVQGLFHILKQCDLIYTIQSDDSVGNAKISEYEQMLGMMKCQDVVRKTRKKHLPKIHRADVDFEQLIYSDLADYVKQLVKEDFGL